MLFLSVLSLIIALNGALSFNLGEEFLDNAENLTFTGGARVRRTYERFGITCNLFGSDEEYTASFELSDEGQKSKFTLKLLYESGTVLFDRTLGVKELFNGRREFAECFDPKVIGRASGCKNCNSMCLRLYDMNIYDDDQRFVNFDAKVEHVTCNEQFFTSIDDCFNKHNKYASCRLSWTPVALSGKDKQATRYRF